MSQSNIRSVIKTDIGRQYEALHADQRAQQTSVETTSSAESTPLGHNSEVSSGEIINITRDVMEDERACACIGERIVLVGDRFAMLNREVERRTFVKQYGCISSNCEFKSLVKLRRTIKQVLTRPLPFDKIGRWWSRYVGGAVSYEAQQEANTILSVIDSDTQMFDEPGASQVAALSGTRNRYNYVSTLVAMCKAECPGIGIDTKANRLVAHAWLFRKMKEHNVRASHIKKLHPLAIEAVFVLNEDELFARSIAQSHAFINRAEEGNRTPYSRDQAWLLNWFGSRRSRPVPSVL